MCKSSFSQIGLSSFPLSPSGTFASGHISDQAILSPTAFAYFMSAAVGASCPSRLWLRLAHNYSALLCSCTMRWIAGHSTRLGSPEFSSLQHSGSAGLVGHSRSTSSARLRHAASLHFIFSLPLPRLSFRTSAGVSSSAHAIEMPLSRSCHAKSPNQAMELTASRRFAQLLINSIPQSAATRAPARGSSSWSR